MNIKCVVSCRDASGIPTFYPVVIECSQEEYDNGDHYDAIKKFAEDEGYEDIGLVYDENDGPKFLFNHYFDF